MKTREEIKALRSGKRYFSAEKIAEEMTRRGKEKSGNSDYHISKQSYLSREVGKIPFSKFEIELLSEILDLGEKKAMEYFY